MTLFAVWARDSKDAGPKRAAHLAAHLAHVEAHMARYRVAGPLTDESGATIGSLLIVAADDMADARAFVATDPYHAAGVWCDVMVTSFAAVAGTWVGGAAWKA